MWLKKLQTNQFRCLSRVDLAFDPICNIISGDNGAGKTSLLESIYFLSRGDSFRTRLKNTLVQEKQDHFFVFGRIQSDTGTTASIGIGWQNRRVDIKINGEVVKNASELAKQLRLILLTPESHRILEGGPSQRRRILDWVMFHVEHRHLAVLQNYQRSLKQRNAALRSGAGTNIVKSWDLALLRDAEIISAWRAHYMSGIRGTFSKLCAELLGFELHLDLHPGIPVGKTLEAVLANGIDSDRQRGYTQHGPHRDMVRIKREGCIVEDKLSRGQSKLVIAAWLLSNLRFVKQQTGQNSLLLMDDLPSELDNVHRERLLRIAMDTGSQVFVSSTDRSLLQQSSLGSAAMFHVEHGQVRQTD